MLTVRSSAQRTSVKCLSAFALHDGHIIESSNIVGTSNIEKKLAAPLPFYSFHTPLLPYTRLPLLYRTGICQYSRKLYTTTSLFRVLVVHTAGCSVQQLNSKLFYTAYSYSYPHLSPTPSRLQDHTLKSL